MHNNPLIYADKYGQFLIPLLLFCFPTILEYALPVAAAAIEEYAGFTTGAAFLTGVVHGYNGNYSTTYTAFSMTEQAGMAIGTMLAINPKNLATKGVANVAKNELVGQVKNRITNLFYNSSARSIAKKATSTSIEKTSKVALGRGVIKESVGSSFLLSSKSGSDFARHLKYSEEYGAESIKFLQNGRIRYYGQVKPAIKPGEMVGARYVHEFNPLRGSSRGWLETLDSSSRIRQVRPQSEFGLKTHYFFDKNGNMQKTW